MREHTSGEIATFSIGVEEPLLDELDGAREVARHFGARHHRLLLTQELARHWIEPFLDALDQPTLDGFNTYCACKLASDHGCKVVLSGIGSDELMGGYPSFQHVPRLLAAKRLLRPFGVGPAARAFERLGPPARLGRMLELLGGPTSLSRAYTAFRGVFTHREAVRIEQTLLGESWRPHHDSAKLDHDDEASSEAISCLELTRYLRNQLLRDADVMSMAHGVELRVPMLDLPLLATLRGISATERFAANKRLLREAVPELPVHLAARRKRGFDLPFASWLRHEWADLAETMPTFPGVSLSPWYRSWSLIVLDRWLRRHGFL